MRVLHFLRQIITDSSSEIINAYLKATVSQLWQHFVILNFHKARQTHTRGQVLYMRCIYICCLLMGAQQSLINTSHVLIYHYWRAHADILYVYAGLSTFCRKKTLVFRRFAVAQQQQQHTQKTRKACSIARLQKTKFQQLHFIKAHRQIKIKKAEKWEKYVCLYNCVWVCVCVCARLNLSMFNMCQLVCCSQQFEYGVNKRHTTLLCSLCKGVSAV